MNEIIELGFEDFNNNEKRAANGYALSISNIAMPKTQPKNEEEPKHKKGVIYLYEKKRKKRVGVFFVGLVLTMLILSVITISKFTGGTIYGYVKNSTVFTSIFNTAETIATGDNLDLSKIFGVNAAADITSYRFNPIIHSNKIEITGNTINYIDMRSPLIKLGLKLYVTDIKSENGYKTVTLQNEDGIIFTVSGLNGVSVAKNEVLLESTILGMADINGNIEVKADYKQSPLNAALINQEIMFYK